ncbi:hypothetical protein [Arthrobacter sp.]|uniref:hypothetical protein n=1 Tax=Arthrobacter sp. TaxID=1667 RepID=UPI003A8D3743
MAIARWLALAVIIIAIIIAVTSCSRGRGGARVRPARGPPAPPRRSRHPPAGGDAVAAGIERAASYNFTLTAVATAADLKALRAAPQDTLEGATVAPQSCRTAVRELNWSPASLGEDSARTDFAADGVDATGSVEVARVTDGTALKAHYATVKQMLGDCSDVTLSISGTEVPLRSTAPPAQVTATATSALLWSRAGKGSDLRQQALVLIGERDGYVAMVSFIGTSGLENAKFSSMAGGILDATLDELA